MLPYIVIGLLVFLYFAIGKKCLRARHLRVIRERRELMEAARRGRKK